MTNSGLTEHSFDMKKKDILDKVLSIVVQQGLHNAPMSQIAREAQVAPGTIYHYFSSKEEILLELYHSIRTELNAVMEIDELEIAGQRAADTVFSALCLRIFKFMIQHPMEFFYLQQYEISPLGMQSELVESHITFPIPEQFFLLPGIKNNLKSMPVSLKSNLVFNAISNMARLQLTRRVTLSREDIQQVIAGCWAMIADG